MSQEAARIRLELAQRLIGTYQGQSSCQGIFAGGSLGRGEADSYSDLEIICLWETLPELSFREQSALEWRAKTPWGFADNFPKGEMISDHFQLEDSEVPVDVVHWQSDAFLKKLAEEVQGRFPAYGFQPILLCLRQAEIWWDPLARVSACRELAHTELPFEKWQNLWDFISIEICRRGFLLHRIRKDWAAFYQQLGIWQMNWVKAWCCVRRRLFSGMKHHAHLLEKLSVEGFALHAMGQAEALELDVITRNMIQDLMDAARKSGLMVQEEAILARLDTSRFKPMI